MNVYFFTATNKDNCKTNCSFPICSEKFLDALQFILQPEIRVLEEPELLQPQLNIPLQSADLLILHIERQEQLAKLIEKKELFEHCKIILILSKEIYHSSKQYHLLNPRFITTSDQNPVDLRNVVYKLIDLMSTWGQYSQIPSASQSLTSDR